jgi:hypothetical protein
MDRRRIATIVTLVILGVIVLFAVRGRDREPPEPEGLVWTLIEAAQEGDVDTYLACFDGDLRQQLEATALEMSRDGFGEYLRSSSDPLTGVAVYDVELLQQDRASLTVEYVYRDATERQRVELTLVRGAWTITGLEKSKRAKPLIPYGAPAAPMPEPTVEANQPPDAQDVAPYANQ